MARLTNRFHGTDPISHRTLIHLPYSYHFFRALYEQFDRLPLVSRLGGRRAYVTGPIEAEVRRRYVESNQRLAALLEVNLDPWGYPMA